MTEPDPIAELVVLAKLATNNIQRHQDAVATESINRAHLIRELYRAGLNSTEIGHALGLSRSRVHQILHPDGKPKP